LKRRSKDSQKQYLQVFTNKPRL